MKRYGYIHITRDMMKNTRSLYYVGDKEAPLSERWLSNGHWAVRMDRIGNPALVSNPEVAAALFDVRCSTIGIGQIPKPGHVQRWKFTGMIESFDGAYRGTDDAASLLYKLDEPGALPALLGLQASYVRALGLGGEVFGEGPAHAVFSSDKDPLIVLMPRTVTKITAADLPVAPVASVQTVLVVD